MAKPITCIEHLSLGWELSTLPPRCGSEPVKRLDEWNVQTGVDAEGNICYGLQYKIFNSLTYAWRKQHRTSGNTWRMGLVSSVLLCWAGNRWVQVSIFRIHFLFCWTAVSSCVISALRLIAVLVPKYLACIKAFLNSLIHPSINHPSITRECISCKRSNVFIKSDLVEKMEGGRLMVVLSQEQLFAFLQSWNLYMKIRFEVFFSNLLMMTS